MDRSFLSDAKVVEASRNFVCIRLATYEDQSEADFLKTLYVGKSGDLENTTFAILSPDASTKLTRTGRAPFHEYRNSRAMADGMQQIAKTHQPQAKALFSDSSLPVTKNLEIGLNVAASDGLPLVVVVSENQQQHEQLAARLLPTAWSEAAAGQFVYAAVTDPKQLKPISGMKPVDGVAAGMTNGILVVQPDQFGVSGTALLQLAPDVSAEEINRKLLAAIASFPRTVQNHNAHVQLGIQLGIEWESGIPETDPESLRAKARARGR